MPSAVGTISQLRVGDVVCATVKDEYFSTLRRAHDIPFDRIRLPRRAVRLWKTRGGRGKGGDLMSRTLDGAMFVKRLNLDDARSLLHDEFLEAYVERLLTVRRYTVLRSCPHIFFHLRSPPSLRLPFVQTVRSSLTVLLSLSGFVASLQNPGCVRSSDHRSIPCHGELPAYAHRHLERSV